MLKPERVVESLLLSYPTLETSERGGILSIVQVSGNYVAKYATNPSGLWSPGIQYNDVEYIDLSRQIDPRRIKEIDVPCGTVGILTEGTVITNWIHVSGTVRTGTKAYAGPSGLITNISSYGGSEIGYFLGGVYGSPGLVIMQGKGFTTSYMQRGTHRIIVDNDPNNIIYALSDGFAKVRIRS